MGNHRFRLSDMLPNSWFYKLKDMGRAGRSKRIGGESVNRNPPRSTTRGSTTPKPPPQPNQAYLPNRASYYLPSKERTANLPHSQIHQKASDTHFPTDSPRKSMQRTRRRPTKPFPNLLSSSVSASRNCRATFTPACKPESIPESSLYRHDDYDDDDDDLRKPIVSEQLEFDSLQVASSASDIISNVGGKGSFDLFKSFGAMESVSELKLPPIVTKPMKKEVDKAEVNGRNASGKQGSYPHSYNMKESSKSPATARRSIQRIKLRAGSPRLGNKKLQAHRSQKTVGLKAAMQQRKGLMEGFVVVKSSLDPRRDFRESMVEMIMENNLRASKDLEELLACYLSLNSKEYHDVIIEVFEQIWFDLTDIIL